MVVNLTDLDRILKEEVDRPLDHRNLNRDVPEFAGISPTAERLAAWIWDRVGARIAREGWPCRLARLRLQARAGFLRRDRGDGIGRGSVMFFKQFYLGCLAQASYLIGSEGEAAVVDPRRDVDEYLEEARREGLTIRHVIETHLHADFVSGHRELARRTGAQIYIGATAGREVRARSGRDGDEISFGDVTLRFLETPGHTPESVCVLVTDRAESDAARRPS